MPPWMVGMLATADLEALRKEKDDIDNAKKAGLAADSGMHGAADDPAWTR